MKNREIAVFGGGCFWCTEALFKSLKGIISTMPGYCEEVETVKIEYNPEIISYEDLLSVFFNTHDPTTANRQGADIGTQYKSAIFYTSPEQKETAESLIEELNKTKAYEKPVVTEVLPLEKFFEAEDYHKNYYENHKDAPYCEIVIGPKLKET